MDTKELINQLEFEIKQTKRYIDEFKEKIKDSELITHILLTDSVNLYNKEALWKMYEWILRDVKKSENAEEVLDDYIVNESQRLLSCAKHPSFSSSPMVVLKETQENSARAEFIQNLQYWKNNL